MQLEKQSSQRSNTRIFHLNDTLGICDKVMRTAVEKRVAGFTRKDGKGMKKNRKFNNEVIEEVKNRIKSFPHYVRERCKRSFMSSELNLTTLYQL